MSLRRLHKMTSSIVKLKCCLLTVGILSACVDTGPAKYQHFAISDKNQTVIQSQPDYLQPAFTKLFQEGKRNQVLNLMQIGKLALTHNDIKEAELAFEQALVQIESVYADNEQAMRARSLWYEEGGKDFKGEPYERAMAYYYRGLIYLVREEYDNARATFLSGIMQDAFAEEEQNRSDFALLLFMAGWASQKMGAAGLAQDAYNELKQFRPDFIPPSAEHNTLVIAETGKSPRKLADGVGHYQLVYRRGKKIKDTQVDIVYGNQRHDLYPMEDIYWQASTRGGRPVDKIIDGQVQFKKNTEKAGIKISDASTDVMLISSALGSSSGTNAGAALSLIGVASLTLSASAKPRVDTRYWNNLPDLVHVTTFESSAETLPESFEYKNDKGETLFSKQPDIIRKADDQIIVWSSNESGS